MPESGDKDTPSRRQIFDESDSGARERPLIPILRSDPGQSRVVRSLADFRESEGRENRKRRLQALWKDISSRGFHQHDAASLAIARAHSTGLTSANAENLRIEYEKELLRNCKTQSPDSSPTSSHIGWPEFRQYAERKEVELWAIFHELDVDGNGHLDAHELDSALRKAGITLSPTTLTDFMTFLTDTPHSHAIAFGEFRDFLLLLPRKVSPAEIFQYYELKKYLGDDGKGAARVTMEGDVSLSAEDKPPNPVHPSHLDLPSLEEAQVYDPSKDEDLFEEDGEEQSHTALKFLLAGGIAGAVSRTCTAPFDRIKIFLITRPPDLGGAYATALGTKSAAMSTRLGAGVQVIWSAVTRIYAEGRIWGFWTGNGLSVAKIFPESAIKFYSYESSKRAFATYWDKVDDPRDIGGFSRFISGGIGGITSQLSIYPIETLKTQMMSNTGQQRRTLISATKHVWALGGMRAYYRGLGIGLVGVFPYSAIDFSTFEALKIAYLRSTSVPDSPPQDPPIWAVLLFGSVSGSVGATSVYPLNLVRTRLQASGSSGHPVVYTGAWDVVQKTMEREGWRGFYRGLAPTLAKVVPAVSISYVVYEHTKRKLGV